MKRFVSLILSVCFLFSINGSTIDGSSYPTSYTGALRITQSLYTLFLSYRG